MRDDKDRSSKWLITHHGDSILRLAGIHGFRSWKPVQAEIVQPRQLPDGLIDLYYSDHPEPDPTIVEITTYPDRRVADQVLRDALFVFAKRRVPPEVITIVLRPLGTFQLSGAAQLVSRHGTFQISFS
jgi:hypothetical protein